MATVAEPSQTALQDGSVLALMDAINSGGAIIVLEAVVVHPVTSMIVTTYVPSTSPVAIVVVWLRGSFQE
jgi:hypothetical protein